MVLIFHLFFKLVVTWACSEHSMWITPSVSAILCAEDTIIIQFLE